MNRSESRPKPKGEKAKQWARELTPEMREQIRALHQAEHWKHSKILLLFASWIGCGAIAVHVDLLWVQIPCWIVAGFALHGLGVFMHEGAHASLFRIPVVDRVVGFLCGLPVLFSCSNYWATHKLHHKYENSAQDPDNLQANFPNPFLRWFIYYGWYAIGMIVYIVMLMFVGPFRADSAKERLLCVLESALIISTAAFVVQLAIDDPWVRHVVIYGWAIPLIPTVIIANVRGLAEHTLLHHEDPPNQLKSTRSLPSNAFVSFFFNNQNYHLEHHLFPRVPWYNLAKVHRVLKPLYEREEASVCQTYLQYLSSAFRYGPTRTVRYAADGRTVLDG